MSETKKNKKIALYLRFAVAAVAIFVAVKVQDLSELKSLICQVDVFALCGAVVIFIISSLIHGYRWYLLVRGQSVEISFAETLKVHFVGLFYNNMLLSAIGGDFLRVMYVFKYTHRKVEAAFSVLIDRFIGFICLLITAGIGYLFVYDKFENLADGAVADKVDSGGGGYEGMLLYAVLGLSVIFVVAMVLPVSRGLLFNLFKKLLEAKERVFEAFKIYLRNPKLTLNVFVLTFLMQSILIFGFWMVGRSIAPEIHIGYYFVVFPITWVISTVPLSPGGLGVVELGIVGLFMVLAGASKEFGLTMAICQRVVFLLGATPGIFIHLAGLHLPKIREESV